ncbi:dna-directed rna polymerase iii subunit rpc6 [Diaporthe amygdali]|uniref:dna-directed rna polymerase iii subunit rpc6 n=1 Tax=Phomopsis amygdali TaxID=1214568 RepID=UPI0022FEF50F|nr:dna-directed rna polymerase iii subunit rpc6 [Diaporthe amygdali]KAJ0122560.1 dna-directed rna polymerase iii subunit rpc6 [Diaporthe amygdali]
MAAVSPSGSDADPAKLSVLKDALYESCQHNGDETRLFSQEDLLSLGVTDDANTLLRVLQALINDRLLISVARQGGGYLWKWRSAADAAKYRALNREQSMVYEMIDDAGADGIWSRTLKARLQMHDSVLKAHLKFLESKGYIKDMKSVEHPNKKMYIKSSLRPSEKATGGPWYTDSNLDEAFISELLKVIFDFITRQSTYRSVHSVHKEKQPKKGVLKGDKEAAVAKGKKRAAEDISGDDPQPAPAPREKHRHREPKRTQLLPLPAGYNAYPTVRQIAELISASGITNNTTLGIADVQQLVDVLVADGLVEPVRVGKVKGYRTVRAAKVDPTPLTALMRDHSMDEDVMELQAQDMGAGPMSNGLTDAPCGRCPVFDLCEEGGPVNPGNCVYFQRWLGD